MAACQSNRAHHARGTTRSRQGGCVCACCFSEARSPEAPWRLATLLALLSRSCQSRLGGRLRTDARLPGRQLRTRDQAVRSRHLIAEALSATASTEREKVRAALDWLRGAPAAARAFVVLSHPTALRSIGDPKFVQFCVQRGGLLLDLPECALDEREHAAEIGR